MKAHPLLLSLLLLAGGASATRVDRLTLDIERPIQPFVVEITEETDTTLRAAIRGSGAEIDLDGWIGVFWYGDEREGLALTNSAAAWGQMEWDLTASLLPTNGRYQAMVLGHRPGRIEEWGRGVLQVRLNPSLDSLPPEWGGAGGEAYIIATQALSAASSASALAQAATNAAGQAAQAAGLLAARAPNWDAAYEWGDHAGLYLGLPGWHTWLSTNTLATTSYVDQAISAIPAPQIDRISSTNQIIDANGDVYAVTYSNGITGEWCVIVPQPINVLGEVIQPSTNRWPGVPYPLWTDSSLSMTYLVTNYLEGSSQPMVVWYRYQDGSGSPHEVHFSSAPGNSDAHWYSNYSKAGAPVVQRTLLGHDDASGWFDTSIQMIAVTNSITVAHTQLVNRVALASELNTGSYVNRQNGTATNLTLAGWVAMPQSQPTNLVLRLVASNEFILVKEVLQ